MTNFITQLLRFVALTSTKNKIDETHGLSHAIDVLNYSQKIFKTEVYEFPPLQRYEKVIYTSAVIHDMCDNKYVDEGTGMAEIDSFLDTKMKMTSQERSEVKDIISTMSYSKVIKEGFPKLGEHQRAYHVVREADLMSAYDFNRCMLYKMHSEMSGDIFSAFTDAENLFKNRVFKHKDDGLLVTRYGIDNHDRLSLQARMQIQDTRSMLHTMEKFKVTRRPKG